MADWEKLHVVLYAGAAEARPTSFELEREIGRPWRARIDAAISIDVSPESILGGPAVLAFGGDGVEHEVAGVITAVDVLWAGKAADAGYRMIELEAASQLALLEQTVDCRIFQELTTQQIVAQLLTEHGLDDSHQRWQLRGTYEARTYCVMWNESAFDFARRLCEEEGIFFWSEVEGGAEVVVFSDDSTSADALAGSAVAVRTPSGLRHQGDVIVDVRPREAIRTGKVTLRDFAFLTPKLDLEGAASASDARKYEASLERYEYGRGFEEAAVATSWSKTRLESLRADRRTVDIAGQCARLRVGVKATLDGAPLDLDDEYFVVRCTQSLKQVEGGFVLDTRATLIVATTPYRLPQTTKRPVMDGPTVGFVVAPAGSEIETVHTDEHGRAKVRFPWDRSGKTADDASCWMRVGQLQTSGSLMLPRIGWEVLVEHDNGDPDRPRITGRLYNGATMPPYALPEGKTRSSLQSASSPGGEGRNEIRFEDAAGSEEIRVEAQKGHKLATAGNKDTKVGANSLQEVGGTRTVTVSGSQTVKVTGGLNDGIKASQTMIVGGNRDVTINAARSTKSGAIAIAIGGNETAMIGNPLQGALDLAAAMAKEKAEEKVAEAFAALEAAANQAVDQIMAPVNEIAGQAEAVGQLMSDVGNGDVGALAKAGAAAAGMGSLVPKQSNAVQGAMGSMVPPGCGADNQSGGQAGNSGHGGQDHGGQGVSTVPSGGGSGQPPIAKGGAPAPFASPGPIGGHSHGASTMPSGGGQPPIAKGGAPAPFASPASGGGHGGGHGGSHEGPPIGKGAHGPAGGGGAQGSGGGGGGGGSQANEAGPSAAVGSTSDADSSSGAGHGILDAKATHSETIGGLRLVATAGKTTNTITGARTTNAGAAKVELLAGDRVEACDAAKSEKAVGLVVLSAGSETETIEGARSTKVGGAIIDKVSGGAALSAGGTIKMAGAYFRVKASSSIVLKCGGSEVTIAGGGIEMKSTLIQIAAGSIKETKTNDGGT